MKAIILSEPGSTDNLLLKDIPIPTIQDNEVLIKVHAISINPIDIKTRKGGGVFQYADLSKETEIILGWDISGVVTESKSDLFKVENAVFGMVNFPGLGKAYAEYVAAPAAQLALKPANISHEEAAAATLAALTAWQNLVQANIKSGDRVLIQAAAGGVGHYAVQMAKHLGAYVIGTSSAANRDFVLSLGADEHIDSHTQTLAEVTGHLDFVLDSLGKESVLRSLDLLKSGGRLMSILSQITDEAQAKAAAKSITAKYTSVSSNGSDMQDIARLLASGEVKSHVSKTFPFKRMADMADAHQQIESGRTVGKIVITL